MSPVATRLRDLCSGVKWTPSSQPTPVGGNRCSTSCSLLGGQTSRWNSNKLEFRSLFMLCKLMFIKGRRQVQEMAINTNMKIIRNVQIRTHLKNAIFWDMAPCIYFVNRRFGGMYHLHLQGIRNPRAMNQREQVAGSSLVDFLCSEDGSETFLRNVG
jgi:hypothetical protein